LIVTDEGFDDIGHALAYRADFEWACKTDAEYRLPTPREIAQGCEAIRAKWSFTEERRRRGILSYDDDRLTAPEVRTENLPEWQP